VLLEAARAEGIGVGRLPDSQPDTCEYVKYVTYSSSNLRSGRPYSPRGPNSLPWVLR